MASNNNSDNAFSYACLYTYFAGCSESSIYREIYSIKCVYLKKRERSKINNLGFHFGKLEKSKLNSK